MKHLAGILFVLAALLLAACGDSSDPAAEAEIRALWDRFKDATLNGKGEAAADCVTQETLDYYDRIRRLALHAERKELEGEALVWRYTVLSIRMRVPADRLAAMSGQDLFAHGVNEGWVGKESTQQQDIGKVSVRGDHASAPAVQGGKTTDLLFLFVRDGGQWRLDMMDLIRRVTPMFDRLRKDSGLSEEQFLGELIDETVGRPLTDADWKPPAGPEASD